MSRRHLAAAIVITAGLTVITGCRQVLSNVFDIPPPTSVRPGPAPAAPPVATAAHVPASQDTVRPPIEETLDRDSARALLPRDHAGNIDWVAADRDGIIRPRSAVPGDSTAPPSRFEFAFDFVYPGPDTTFDARFPHSTHTQWVACQQCHPRIFRYRNTPITMVEIFQGKYCAECHGPVAYPVQTACERCHQNLAMPAGRAPPDLLGDIVMRRVETDSSHAAGVLTNDLPRATFPHWVHRIRFRCKVCHMEIFEPQAGANEITMQDLANGEACGRCHNGVTAFTSGFGSCQRCHVAPAGTR